MNSRDTYTIPERTTQQGSVVPPITVDDDIKEIVLLHSWFMAGNATMYPSAWINGKIKSLHKFVWELKSGPAPCIIDHIDRNTLNATFRNLRSANASLNNRNKNLKRGKYLPGTWKRGNTWQSRITINKRFIHLGEYKTEEDAHVRFMEERAKLLAA